VSLEKANILIEEHENQESKPKFPFPQGAREYQKIAYLNWVENDRKGLFAMATGTGKTLTALNCILADYKLNDFYKFIVLVPTTALLNNGSKKQRKSLIIKVLSYVVVRIIIGNQSLLI
jgi:superfamily II DNA or RNA helicase